MRPLHSQVQSFWSQLPIKITDQKIDFVSVYCGRQRSSHSNLVILGFIVMQKRKDSFGISYSFCAFEANRAHLDRVLVSIYRLYQIFRIHTTWRYKYSKMQREIVKLSFSFQTCLKAVDYFVHSVLNFETCDCWFYLAVVFFFSM